MFSSRLRTWMENHIGRPRKRNNKNKHGSGNEVLKEEASHFLGYGFTTAVSTAAISNGNTSHLSSNGAVSSPVRRREVSPIQNHSRYGWQSPDSETITSPKSDNYLYAPKFLVKHEPTVRHQLDLKKEKHTLLSDLKGFLPTHIKSQVLPENSSSSFSSLSWSTGSKEQSAVSIEKQKASSGAATQLQIPIITYQAASEVDHLEDEVDAVHYEEIPTTILRHHESHANRNCSFEERPKSEQLTKVTPLYSQEIGHAERRSMNDSNSVRYGKLLPSKIQVKYPGSSESLATGSAEFLPLHKPLGNAVQSSQHCCFRNGRVRLLGTKASNNGNVVPLYSLSSPESAYSTGYSTDGTSPGACYASNQAPEYYINIRSGTHYFQKGVNSLAIETQRRKFGLNKIEEMSPIDPLPKTCFATACNKTSKSNLHPCAGSPLRKTQAQAESRNVAVALTLQENESSSPRPRCRIRTNPWVSTHDSLALVVTTSQQLNNTLVTSSSDCSVRTLTAPLVQKYVCISTNGDDLKPLNDNKRKCLTGKTNNSLFKVYKQNGRAMYDSSSSLDTEDTKQCTMSLTEVDASGCPRASMSSPLLLAKRLGKREPSVVLMQPVAYFDASEEDATLNEMMGKFDESYVYEKETDILSDSDATNCPSELDTGEAGDDAEDECETDELLDIDFIYTTSTQEVAENRLSEKTSPCMRHSFLNSRSTADKGRNFMKNMRWNSVGRRRKRLVKTRKKGTAEQKENVNNSSSLPRSRETRSVGGTPISRRRNARESKERSCKILALSERASSLIFPHDQPRRYMTVAESNKALLKADLEADFKYRQLIQEAESILVSLKTSAQSLPRETPISSPRRINPLINKRVEMLKSNEIKQSLPQVLRSSDMEHDFSAVLNKRIERLKYESTSAPNSPRSAPRVSPRKTHITNFISQIDGQRKTFLPPSEHLLTTCASQGPPRSPSKVTPLQRKSSLRKESWNFYSEPETEHTALKFLVNPIHSSHKMDFANHNFLPESSPKSSRRNLFEDFSNQNINIFETNAQDIEISTAIENYCPQSEPLKRKVYKGSYNFDRIDFQSNLVDTQNNQRTWLAHRSSEKGTQKTLVSTTSSHDINLNSPLLLKRKQLLVDTLSELKQNLENQSVELNELNVD